MKIYQSIDQLIGNTPLLEFRSFKKNKNLNCNIFAKLECFNPGSSLKDRIAFSMLKKIIDTYPNYQDLILIAPTSGNTGIALSFLCAKMNLKLIIIMPENMSIERHKLIKIYGAKLILTSKNDGMSGSINKAVFLNKNIKNSIILDQFSDEENPRIHYQTTGPEIDNSLNQNIDYFIAGIGTGGSISGIGKYLKEKHPNIKIIGVEPSSSPFLSQGIKGSHNIQGIGAGFVPQNLDVSLIDEYCLISEKEAFDMIKDTARIEGLLIGISSGAVLSAALKIAKKQKEKKNIVVLLPDNGERYLSIIDNL